MPELVVCNLDGEPTGSLNVDVDISASARLIHQSVLTQLAGRRHGTHQTKGRSDVRGGGRKPYRQKGTGRARQGSRRAPHFRGGATVHGPRVRDYHQSLPRSTSQAVFRAAFTDRMKNGAVKVIDSIEGFDGKTGTLIQTLIRLELMDDSVVIIGTPDEALSLRKASANLKQVRFLYPDQTGLLDVLNADAFLLTRSALDVLSRRLSG